MTVPKQLDLPRIRNFQAERANTYEEPKAAKRWNWSQSKQINMITVATSGVEREADDVSRDPYGQCEGFRVNQQLVMERLCGIIEFPKFQF